MTLEQESTIKRAGLLSLKVFGGACWVGAYREAIKETEEAGNKLLPESAIVFNLTWEAIYSAGGVWKWKTLTLEDRTQTVINIAWLVNDIQWAREIRQRGTRVHPAVIASAVAYHLYFVARNPPGEAARMSALWQNLAFSAYCALSKSKNNASSHARKFTLFRSIGTAIPTATSGALRGIEAKYLIPGLGCIAFDLLRISTQRRGRT